MIGRKLSQFQITDKLGEGGMGEVYRATDETLEREVAIKVLPEAFGSDPERSARFEREAKVLASLNHPAIAGIHQVGENEGRLFLVMELADGETLEERLERGAISLQDALPIARRIAEGLEAAHAHGVVHRDLKPANIKVSSGGEVKILDFGLAKALAPPGTEASPLSVSPTLTAGMTRAGTLLGTAAYMSPEQARGLEADKRADVWAFGAVLYEMLTGRQAFPGDHLTDVLAAIVQRDPDWSLLPAEVPEPVRRLLRRCLAREPARRLRDLGDALLELEESEETESAGLGPDTAEARPIMRLVPWLIAGAAIAAGLLIGLGLREPGGSPAPRPVVRASLALPDGVLLAGWSSPAVAVSPDERIVAFVGRRDGKQELYLRYLDQSEAVVVPDSAGAEGPFFSPDGRWIAFGAGSISSQAPGPPLLKRAPVGGGPTQDVTPLSDFFGGSWGEDGFLYFVDSGLKGQLLRVPAEGGQAPVAVSEATGSEELARRVVTWPQSLPGGRQILLISSQDLGGDGAALLDLDTGRIEDLVPGASFARYAPSGHLIYARTDGVLRAAPFDLTTNAGVGPSVPLIRDIAFTANGAAVFAVGGRGSALFATGYVQGSDRVLSRLIRIHPSGEVEPLTIDPEAFGRRLSLDPEGNRLVIPTWDGSLWIYDLIRGTRLRLPSSHAESRKVRPLWSPDGETIVFSDDRPEKGGFPLYAQRADGSGKEWLLSDAPGENEALGWTPDSREVVFRHWDTGVVRFYRVAAAESAPREPISMENGGAVSPDGRWMAYSSRESGRPEVYLTRFPGGGAVIPVSTGGGVAPRWSRAGDALYFVRGCSFLLVPVRVTPGLDLELGAERPLVDDCGSIERRRGFFDVGPEGSLYLQESLTEENSVGILELVLHWSETLERSFEG